MTDKTDALLSQFLMSLNDIYGKERTNVLTETTMVSLIHPHKNGIMVA